MRILVVTLLVLAGLAADAAAHIRVAVDATSRRGVIDLYGIVSRSMPTATFYELVDGRDKKLAEVTPAPWYDDADHGPLGFAIEPAAAVWRCDRLYRTFVIVGRYPDGAIGERGVFSVRTPSCRHRLSLKAPRRARPGGFVTMRIRDTFGTGGTRGRVCLSGVCRGVRLASGQTRARVRLRVRDRTGIRPLKLSGAGQRLEQSIAVGVRPTASVASGPTVLTTGDSLMQNLDAILTDRLAKRANVVSDLRFGVGADELRGGRLSELASQQVARHHPRRPSSSSAPTNLDDGDACGETSGAASRPGRTSTHVVLAGDGDIRAERRGDGRLVRRPANRDERRTPAQGRSTPRCAGPRAGRPPPSCRPTSSLTPRGVFEPTLPRGGRRCGCASPTGSTCRSLAPASPRRGAEGRRPRELI